MVYLTTSVKLFFYFSKILRLFFFYSDLLGFIFSNTITLNPKLNQEMRQEIPDYNFDIQFFKKFLLFLLFYLTNHKQLTVKFLNC